MAVVWWSYREGRLADEMLGSAWWSSGWARRLWDGVAHWIWVAAVRPSRLSCTLLYSDSPPSTSERQVVVQHPLVSRPSGGTRLDRGARRATRWQEAHQSRDSQSRQVEPGVQVARQRPPAPTTRLDASSPWRQPAEYPRGSVVQHQSGHLLSTVRSRDDPAQAGPAQQRLAHRAALEQEDGASSTQRASSTPDGAQSARQPVPEEHEQRHPADTVSRSGLTTHVTTERHTRRAENRSAEGQPRAPNSNDCTI